MPAQEIVHERLHASAEWTLSQTGNWARDKEDLNGDGDFVDTGEVDDTRTHNAANELLTRDTDSNASVNYTLTHDEVGNLTDDGKDYKFVYDAFGRLRTVKNQSNTVVAEYTYNGLNMRIGWHYDADADADVDGSDPWYSFAMDDRWRIVATFRGSDTSPKELFAYHNAGANGRGSSSYIDSVILRNRDANTSWTSSADGVLEERVYYVQNWRADVSAVLSDAGVVKEWVKYTSYGIPFRIDPGDYNRDGFVNGTDSDDYGDDFDNTRAEADVDFDGDVDEDDYDLFSAWWDAPSTAGRFTLSASSVGNRIGYAGYQHDPTFVGASRAIYHVRHRVYDAVLGRWTRRDPAGYRDNKNLFGYVRCEPITKFDLTGLGISDLSIVATSHKVKKFNGSTEWLDAWEAVVEFDFHYIVDFFEPTGYWIVQEVVFDPVTNERCNPANERFLFNTGPVDSDHYWEAWYVEPDGRIHGGGPEDEFVSVGKAMDTSRHWIIGAHDRRFHKRVVRRARAYSAADLLLYGDSPEKWGGREDGPWGDLPHWDGPNPPRFWSDVYPDTAVSEHQSDSDDCQDWQIRSLGYPNGRDVPFIVLVDQSGYHEW